MSVSQKIMEVWQHLLVQPHSAPRWFRDCHTCTNTSLRAEIFPAGATEAQLRTPLPEQALDLAVVVPVLACNGKA